MDVAELIASKRRALSRLFAFIAILLAGAGAHAIGGAAGSIITNTASASFVVSGIPDTVDSNPEVFAVDEVLDLTLVSNDAGNVNATTPDTDVPMSFTLTNTGNGNEPFALLANPALAGDDFDPQVVRIYIDDGDSVFGIGSDTLYVSGVNDPVLAADSSRVLFVIANIPAALASGDVGLASLQATAVTGSGTPGTVFAGAGDAGVDAVVGATTANASEQNGYAVAQITTTLLKSQDRPEGATVASGDTVTYTLLFTVTGTGTVLDTLIVDAIPVGTTYIPGSLTLDSAQLTDATDSDAGRFTGTQIEVVPGTAGAMPAPGTATVTFQVTIN